MKSTLLVLSLLTLFAGRVCAWSGPGHMTVAAIAYRDLSPQQRQHAVDLLKNHYNYDKWKAEAPAKDAVLDEGIVLFMGASKWPDEIKYGKSTFNHPEWHYVDYPVMPPNFPLKPSPSPDNDVVFAINFCVKSLKDPATSSKAKAYWLSWLMHLIEEP